jgi:hypothetical protein
VLFVAFIGFVQANHVHSDDSRLPSHECSICAVAHAGVLQQLTYRPLIVFVATTSVTIHEVAARSFDGSSSIYIRPPPEL